MMNRSLRFCMITTFYPPYNFGGDGISVHQLSNELARRGHQVEVIHCIDAYRFLAGKEPEATYDDHPNVKVHGLKSRFGFLSPLATQQTGFPFFKLARIKQILKKSFDVIHYHNISLVGGPKILEYGQGIKLYTIHDYWLICPTHVLFKFNRAACMSPHCFLCNFAYKRPPQWWRHFGLLKAAIKHVDAFLAFSCFCKNIHHRMGFNANIVHMPNFVSLAESVLSKSKGIVSEVSKKPYFLFVGRLEKLKGVQTLIPVFRHYHKAHLLIAGTGSYERRLKQLARGCTNIRFLGYQSDRQLQVLYRQAVAVIIPSQCFDIATLVNIEAFREQTPVIVRNLGGIPEIVEESGGEFIYETEEELVVAMDQILANPSYRRELGIRGYKVYRERRTPESYLKRYFALIHEIASDFGNCSASSREEPYVSEK